MDLWTFALFLEDIAPSFEMIDDRIFIDRQGTGIQKLREKAANYRDLAEAQRWINMVPIDDLLDCACGDWALNDPALEKIVSIYRLAWLTLLSRKYGERIQASVQLLIDEDSGDVIIYLKQE